MNTNKKLVTLTFYKNIVKQFLTVALLLKKKCYWWAQIRTSKKLTTTIVCKNIIKQFVTITLLQVIVWDERMKWNGNE